MNFQSSGPFFFFTFRNSQLNSWGLHTMESIQVLFLQLLRSVFVAASQIPSFFTEIFLKKTKAFVCVFVFSLESIDIVVLPFFPFSF